MVETIHICKSGPSDFRPVTTSGVLSLGVCCALTGMFPACNAGVLGSHNIEGMLCICLFIRSKNQFRHLGPSPPKSALVQNRFFRISIHVRTRLWIFSDYSSNVITYGNVSIIFRLVLVDASMTRGPPSFINFAELILENVKIFSFPNYTTVRVPLYTPTILFFHHYRSTSVVWKINNLCDDCLEIISLQSGSSSATVPSQNHANVMYVYVNHRPFEIWLRIRFPSHFKFIRAHPYR